MGTPAASAGRAPAAPVAYVDESARVTAGLYVFAAAVLEPSAHEEARARMRALAPKSGRLHWRDDTTSIRRKAVAAVAELPAVHVVVVGRRFAPAKQERARVLCLQRLLRELAGTAVERVWMESRGVALNKRDIGTVTRMHAHGDLPRRVQVEHQVPSVEPLLWIADVVAGACGLAEVGERENLDTLAPAVMRHEVDVLAGS